MSSDASLVPSAQAMSLNDSKDCSCKDAAKTQESFAQLRLGYRKPVSATLFLR